MAEDLPKGSWFYSSRITRVLETFAVPAQSPAYLWEGTTRIEGERRARNASDDGRRQERHLRKPTADGFFFDLSHPPFSSPPPLQRPKPPPPATPNTTEFEDARAMSLPEVRALLDARRQEREAADGAAGGAALLPPLVHKALAYAERFDAVRSGVKADQLHAALSSKGLSHVEVAALINLSPGTAEEARALIGTLAESADDADGVGGGDDDDLDGGGGGAPRFSDADLQAILDEIATWKSLD